MPKVEEKKARHAFSHDWFLVYLYYILVNNNFSLYRILNRAFFLQFRRFSVNELFPSSIQPRPADKIFYHLFKKREEVETELNDWWTIYEQNYLYMYAEKVRKKQRTDRERERERIWTDQSPSHYWLEVLTRALWRLYAEFIK